MTLNRFVFVGIGFWQLLIGARVRSPSIRRSPSDVQAETNRQGGGGDTSGRTRPGKKPSRRSRSGTAKGKPYIPWAAKPDDLPQAKIPAFPGAEGRRHV